MQKPIFVILLLFAGFSVSAQVAFGVKGGVNLTTLNVDDPELSYDSRTGYHAGIFLRGKFDKVGIQPELLFFTQSGEFKSAGIFGTTQESFTYLSIPVILKFYPIAGLKKTLHRFSKKSLL